MSRCRSCSIQIEETWKLCPNCGLPLVSKASEPVVLVRPVISPLNELVSAQVLYGEVTPNTFGSPLLEELVAGGRFATAETDFDAFGTNRHPLEVTIILAEADSLPGLFKEFMSASTRTVFGYVEAGDEILIFVTGEESRSECLPTGLNEIAETLNGTVTVLLECRENRIPPVSMDCFYSESDDIVKVLQEAKLTSRLFVTPEKYGLQDQIESSVFQYFPDENNPENFVSGVVYVGKCEENGTDIELKGMFDFDSRTLKALLKNQNWIIELGGEGLNPQEFAAVAEEFKDFLEAEMEML